MSTSKRVVDNDYLLKNYKVDHVSKFLVKLYKEVGLSRNDASILVDSLITSNLCGYDSHGIMRTAHYIEKFENGSTKVNPEIKIKNISASAIIVDGDYGAGQIVSMRAVKNIINIAGKTGIAVAAIKNSNHFGRAGYYTSELAKNGKIGIAMTHTDANTVPDGGTKPYFGTNVISFSAPSSGDYPIIIDFSMSKISFGKVYDAKLYEKLLPENVALDTFGNITNDPNKVEYLIPMAEYKGYSLSMMIEILCALLVGMPFGPYVVDMYKQTEIPRKLGHIFIAIDIEKFRDINEFKNDIFRMISDLHRITPQNGLEKVRVPGESTYNVYNERTKNGIPLPSTLINELKFLADKYNIIFPVEAIVS